MIATIFDPLPLIPLIIFLSSLSAVVFVQTKYIHHSQGD
jgi:hypothetical protein